MPTDDTAQETQISRRSRETRLNLRADAQQDALIRRAAQVTNRTVTDFVLDSASTAAERVLADRRWFLLDDSAWANFEDLLERPVVKKPRLAAMLAEKHDLFDE